MKISVIGLGKLGLPIAATIASKGFQVIGVDVNRQIVDALNNGMTHLSEPNLLNLIKKYKRNLKGITEINEAVLNSEITFIVAATPSQKNGYFSLQYIDTVMKEIGQALKNKEKYHLVVVVSTIMPNSMEELKKILEKTSGKICSKDFGLCYNPEFIALGSVIYNLLNPDFVLIGESDKKAGDILKDFYSKYCDNKPRIARMSFVNAELVKISVNTFITTKISYANMLAEICEKLPGGNVDIVTKAIGLDSRIGSKYLKGGPAFGGPCFPRDNVAFVSLARNLKSSFGIAESAHRINLKQIERLIKLVMKHADKNSRVGIFGLSYKPFTDVIEESSGILLAQYLIKKSISVNVHDPSALKNTKKILGERAKYIFNLEEAINKSQIIVVATDWPEYRDIRMDWFKGDPKVLIDPWRLINANQLPKGVKYVPFGLNLIEE